MHGVKVVPNESDYRGHSYTIWVTKMDKIIIHNTKNIHTMPLNAEQYLCEQIRETTGQLECIKAITTEADEPPRPQAWDYRAGITQAKTKQVESKGNISPMQ